MNLPKRDIFLEKNYRGIGVFGQYIPNRDAIHTGLFWSWESENKIAHFINTNQILITDFGESVIENCYFNEIPEFEERFIDSLTALAELISLNRLDTLIINVGCVVYKDGKFDMASGFYLVDGEIERIINCAVFVIALLNTYDYKIANVDSWPSVTDATKNTYLEGWLNHFSITGTERDKYYAYNKEIRGKHILVAPSAVAKPANYTEANALSDTLLTNIRGAIA